MTGMAALFRHILTDLAVILPHISAPQQGHPSGTPAVLWNSDGSGSSLWGHAHRPACCRWRRRRSARCAGSRRRTPPPPRRSACPAPTRSPAAARPRGCSPPASSRTPTAAPPRCASACLRRGARKPACGAREARLRCLIAHRKSSRCISTVTTWGIPTLATGGAALRPLGIS